MMMMMMMMMMITLKRMIPKCSKLVQGMTLGYSRSDIILGLKGQRSRLELGLGYLNTAWVGILWVPSSYRQFLLIQICATATSDESVHSNKNKHERPNKTEIKAMLRISLVYDVNIWGHIIVHRKRLCRAIWWLVGLPPTAKRVWDDGSSLCYTK